MLFSTHKRTIEPLPQGIKTDSLNKALNKHQLEQIVGCECAEVHSKDKLYHLLAHFGVAINVESVRRELMDYHRDTSEFFQHAFKLFLGTGGRPVHAEMLVTSALDENQPCWDVALFLLACKHNLKIYVITGGKTHAWTTHPNLKIKEANLILVRHTHDAIDELTLCSPRTADMVASTFDPNQLASLSEMHAHSETAGKPRVPLVISPDLGSGLLQIGSPFSMSSQALETSGEFLSLYNPSQVESEVFDTSVYSTPPTHPQPKAELEAEFLSLSGLTQTLQVPQHASGPRKRVKTGKPFPTAASGSEIITLTSSTDEDRPPVTESPPKRRKISRSSSEAGSDGVGLHQKLADRNATIQRLQETVQSQDASLQRYMDQVKDLRSQLNSA